MTTKTVPAISRGKVAHDKVCKIQLPCLFRHAACALFIASLALAATNAFANAVGNITEDTYKPAPSSPNSGLDMLFHYSISDLKGLEKCCDPKNLRWMQLVTSSAPTTFTPDPNRPFIDPRKGQKGGQYIGDNLPYYDGTSPRDPKYRDPLNYGIGPYISDQPQVANNLAKPADDKRHRKAIPYTFTADTVLVCITSSVKGQPTELKILGGFQWGFTISATEDNHHKITYTTSALKLTPLSDSVQLEDQFNDALKLDFPGYKVVPCKNTACGDTTFNFVTPEPSGLLLLGSGILGLGRVLRKRLLART